MHLSDVISHTLITRDSMQKSYPYVCPVVLSNSIIVFLVLRKILATILDNVENKG